MRVLVCYAGAGLHPDTLAAVMAYAPAAGQRVRVDTEEVSAGEYAYWQAIAARWDGSRDLVVVEQDIVIHRSVIPQFLDCGEPWCAFGYPGRGGEMLTDRLGCTRFSAVLQRHVPAVEFEQDGRLLQVEAPAGAWLTSGPAASLAWPFLDMTISARLYARGLVPHVHHPGVEHRHDYGRIRDDGDVREEADDHGGGREAGHGA